MKREDKTGAQSGWLALQNLGILYFCRTGASGQSLTGGNTVEEKHDPVA